MLYRPNRIILSPLLSYAVIVFWLGLQDAVMSYATPVYLERVLGNPLLMGILIGIASLVGLIFDLLISRFLSQRSFHFFLLTALAAAVAFPSLLLMLPPVVGYLGLAMAVWGGYYELSQFAHFNFVHAFLAKEEHARAWGTISVFKALAYLTGSLLAGFLVGIRIEWAFKTVLFLVGVGLVTLMIFLKKHNRNKILTEKEINHHGLWQEVKIWRVLMRKVWPLWLFVLAIFLIDATFWSVGTVLSEELRKTSSLGGSLLALYMLPSLMAGFLAERLARPLGKKRIAFLAGMGYGCLLMVAGAMPSVPLILLTVLLAALLGAVAVPEILAVFQDFVARSGIFSGEIISLERSAENLAFIIGPIMAGAIALAVGFQETLTVMGGILFLIASLAFLVVPQKIHLPQQKLKEVSLV